MSTLSIEPRRRITLPAVAGALVGGLVVASTFVTVAAIRDDEASAPRPAAEVSTQTAPPAHDPLVTRFGQPETQQAEQPMLRLSGPR